MSQRIAEYMLQRTGKLAKVEGMREMWVKKTKKTNEEERSKLKENTRREHRNK